METRIKQAMVTDCNNRPLGRMPIKVELWDDANINSITHKGELYFPTGKTGTNKATGKAVIEMEADNYDRLWATLDANMIFED